MPKYSLLKSDYDPDFIKSLSLFSGLAEEEKNALLQGGQILSLRRGQSLFRQDDNLGSFYVVCNGLVKVSRVTPDGREVTLDILVSGDMTCAKEIFELSDVHMVNAMAISDTIVMSFPKNWLLETAQKSGVFALNLLAAISRSARMTEMDAEHQATMSAPQLLSCFLIHLCERYNFDPRGFLLPLSKSLIASRLGMELETLSRTLPVLKKYGITVKGKNVALNDFPGIDEHVCNHCSVRDTCEARLALSKQKEAGHSLKTELHLA